MGPESDSTCKERLPRTRHAYSACSPVVPATLTRIDTRRERRSFHGRHRLAGEARAHGCGLPACVRRARRSWLPPGEGDRLCAGRYGSLRGYLAAARRQPLASAPRHQRGRLSVHGDDARRRQLPRDARQRLPSGQQHVLQRHLGAGPRFPDAGATSPDQQRVSGPLRLALASRMAAAVRIGLRGGRRSQVRLRVGRIRRARVAGAARPRRPGLSADVRHAGA